MHPPPLLIMDFVGPVIGALVFVVIMSLVSEPARRTINAMIVAGASGAYLSGGGFGIWEVAFPVLAMPLAYRGLRSYSFIGLAWLLHSCWDVVHHLWGNPIWPFMPTSSFGCMIFDALIALWFLAGAPSLVHRMRAPAAALE
jgi:Family of unknown function (DUF6010)